MNKPKQVNKGSRKGVAHIHCTFNNTIINISDVDGNTIAWASAGTLGFSGTKKGTPFAAQIVADSVAKKAIEKGVKEVNVQIKGPGSGRETAIRTLQTTGIEVASIKDVTPIPHNGCRPSKRRRV